MRLHAHNPNLDIDSLKTRRSQAITKKRGGNFFSKMGKGQPHPISLPEFLKFFQAVGRAKGEKSLLSLLNHIKKGVPNWCKANSKM